MMMAAPAEHERSPTPIISNRSPPKEPPETHESFSLESSCEDTVEPPGKGGAPIMDRDRLPRFSCPNEDPIIVSRPEIASRLAIDEEKNSPRTREDSRPRNRRKRRIYSSTPFSFSLLFPASKPGRRSSQSKDDTKGDHDYKNKVVRKGGSHAIGANDVWVFFWEVLQSTFPLNTLRLHRIVQPSWFLPSSIFSENCKPPSFQPISISKMEELQLQRKKRRQSAKRRRERPVRISGLPNQGQTCFLNSVLQSLASLEPFLEYLEGIVQFQEEIEHVSLSASLVSEFRGDDDKVGYGLFGFGSNANVRERKRQTRTDSFTKDLLNILKGVNNSDGILDEDEDRDEILLKKEGGITTGGLKTIFASHGARRRQKRRLNPKALLQRIARSNAQFSSYGMYEQQDAQELFASLMEVVIHDSALDASPSDRRLESVSDNGNETNLLSLSDFLAQLGDREQDLRDGEQHSKGELDSESISVMTAHRKCVVNEDINPVLREEKKQDHTDNKSNRGNSDSSSVHRKPLGLKGCEINGITPKPAGLHADTLIGKKSMRSIMSSITPSPLSGWLGSTLRCSRCKHVRPIQNAPFLDVPLVPTSVPNYLSNSYTGSGVNLMSPSASSLPSCSLEECLDSFTSVERVQDVECRFCTIQNEIENLEEEAMMIKGAVETTERRLSRKSVKTNERDEGFSDVESWEQTKCLRHDLKNIQKKLTNLKMMDPDEEEHHPLQDEDVPLFGALDHNEKIPIQRCDAKKCLLLTRCPSILCCHVQRRYYDPFKNRMEKCVQFVRFPLFLDLSPYCAYGQKAIIPWVAGSLMKQCTTGSDSSEMHWNQTRKSNGEMMYQLRSVIEHRGNAFGGHYVAYRRDHSGTWFCISDNQLMTVSWRDVQACQAYMLFYEAM